MTSKFIFEFKILWYSRTITVPTGDYVMFHNIIMEKYSHRRCTNVIVHLYQSILLAILIARLLHRM